MIIIKQNDTMPAIEAQLIDVEGNPINLDLCGVMFHMVDAFGDKVITRPAIISDPALGKIRVDWQPRETDTAGIYKAEFEVTFTDDSILTVPNDGYVRIEIVKDLG